MTTSLKETQSTLDTNPNNYIGFEVGEDGKPKKKKKDMKDKDLHEPVPPDGPTPPAISVQAENILLYLINTEGKEVSESDLSSWSLMETPQNIASFKIMQRRSAEDPSYKMVWENTTTGGRGFVLPSTFVKVYSKMLVAEQEQAKEAREQVGSEQKPMSESKPNMALANELLNVGLVNNVKKSTEVLREDNPMRKAMEIFYTSKNSNADKDEVKYVPSVIKEGKAVLDKKSAPVVAPKEEAETPKKKIYYW